MPPLAAETPQPDDSASTSTSTDGKLLAFLRQKLAGVVLPAAAAAAHFHDADIYAAEPATLTSGFDPAPAKKSDDGGSWFFFTHVKPKSHKDSRKSRMVGGGAGTWHSERAPRAVLDDEGSCVGHSQYFCYKRKTGKNCHERTDWYMVEFTEGQEGDHDRVHGGEPMLVLCKIYRAHSSSRSSSSRSARKRKPTDEHVDQSSAPVKVKRRLFAPASTPAATSQEQVSSGVTMVGSHGQVALEVSDGNVGSTSYDPILCAKLVAALNKTITATPMQNMTSTGQNKTSTSSSSTSYDPILCAKLVAALNKTITATPMQNMTSTGQNKTSTSSSSLVLSESDFLRFWPSHKIDGTSDYLQFSSETEELQHPITTAPSLLILEPEVSTLQGVPGLFECGKDELQKIHSTSDYLEFSSEMEALHKRSSTPPIVSMLEPKVSALQCETTTFDWGTEASQMINAISDYLKLSSETETLQKASNAHPNLSMFEPEVSALQGETTSFDWGTEASQKIDDTSDFLKLSSEIEALQKISTTPPSLLMFEPESSALQDCCTPPASAHCYGMTDPMDDEFSPRLSLWEQDAWSWTGNDNSTTTSFCRDRTCSVGALPKYDVWGC